jgi:hypothetical protein
MFCNFTKLYINHFIKNKYNLIDNNNLLLSLINKKEDILNFINNTNINITYNYNIKYDISKYLKSYFIDYENVKLQINDLKKNILIKWNNNKIYILSKEINKKLLLKIKLCIYILEYLRNNNKNIKIILLLTDLIKYSPINNEIIDVKHINSGYSYDNKIVIWRYEEFEKVLLHEIIHVLNLDKRDTHVDNIINTKFHNYFEALTDFYAILYHIIYISLITNTNLKLLLEIELSFIKNQAFKMASILNFNISNFKYNINIKQNTSAFSYFILKYLLFEYIIQLSEKDIFKYLNNINYNLLLNNIKNIKIKKYNYKIFTSLRMTLLQLK